MDLALGAMANLAPKLGDLLMAEYVVQKGLKPDIESLSRELVVMKASMVDSSRVPPDQLSEVDKLWARQVQELSYDMEDVVDDFILRVAGGGKSADTATDTNIFKKILGKATTAMKKVKYRHEISDKVKDIKKLSNELASLRAKYTVRGAGADLAASTGIDPRVINLYKKESDLVGIEESRDRVIKILKIEHDGDVSDQSLKIVSIVGVGGLGKTTLAKTVHDMLIKKQQFGACAFISVGRNPSLTRTFEKMLEDLDDEKYSQMVMSKWNEERFIKELQKFLQHKRYFIVVDDIWDLKSWETIRHALKDNNCRSRIIMTTRNFEVATKAGEAYKLKPLSDENSKNLFYKRIQSQEGENLDDVSGELSSEIIDKCGGIPLAIIAIASLLVERPYVNWSKVYDSIGFGNGDNTTKILAYSYYDLPSYLKPCLLQLSIFPEDYFFDAKSVVWMWIAEGFVHLEKAEGSLFEVGERYFTDSLFEVGQRYFTELVNRSLIEPAEDRSDWYADKFHIHDIVFDVIRKLVKHEDFITVLDRSEPHSDSKVRRLAVRNHQRFPEDIMDKSKVLRSLYIVSCKIAIMPPLDSFKVCHVLFINASYIPNSLKHLGRLLHLKYLAICDTPIDDLPKEIGHLMSLQTLVLVNIGIEELSPVVCKLTQLMCLVAFGFKRFPTDRIGNLTSLEELRLQTVDGWSDTEDLTVELGKLTRLRVVQIMFSDELGRRSQHALVQSLCNIGELQELVLSSSNKYSTRKPGETVWEDWKPPRQLQRLLIPCTVFMRLPRWINHSHLRRLCFLCMKANIIEVHDLDNLSRLPELWYLELYGFILPPGYIVGTDGFKKLRFCKVGTALKFHKGAMPRLEELHFAVHAGYISWKENGVLLEQFPTKDVIEDLDLGLHYLLSLEKVIFDVNCSGATAAKVHEAEAVVTRAIENHPNRPTVKMDRAYEEDMLSYEERVALQTIRRRCRVLQLKDEPDAFFINHLRSYRGRKKAVIHIDCTGASMCEVEKVEASFRHAAEVRHNHPSIRLIRTNTDKMVSSSDHTDTELDDDQGDSPNNLLCKLQLDDKCHDLPQLSSTALAFSFGVASEEHYDSTASKRCASRKRRIDSTLKPRPKFKDPSAARADFSGDDDHDDSLDNLLCKLQLGN